MNKYILIELYTNMPSNNIEDYKPAGDFIKIEVTKGLELVNILINECVEFAVYKLGDCIIDRSYEYWKDGQTDEGKNVGN